MLKGGRMITYFLLVLAALMFTLAAYAYFHSDDKTMSALNSEIKDAKVQADFAVKRCSEVSQTIVDLNAKLAQLDSNQAETTKLFTNQIKKLRDDHEVLLVRFHGFEKKLISKEKTVNVNIIDNKSKSKPLLNRAGVTP